MRLKFTLFDVLILLIPAVATFLGVMVAVLQSGFAVTIAQLIYLLSLLAAISFLFHRRNAVRAFSIVFLAASLSHLWLTHTYGTGFVTSQLFQSVYLNIQPTPSRTTAPQTVAIPFLPSGNSGGFPVYSGGYSGLGGGLIFPAQPVVDITAPFVQAGNWALSILIGVVCGLFAKAMKTAEEQEKNKAGMAETKVSGA